MLPLVQALDRVSKITDLLQQYFETLVLNTESLQKINMENIITNTVRLLSS